MLEILIRENGGEPKWVAASEVLGIIMKKKPKTSSPSPSSLKGFDVWWKKYDKKVTKKQAMQYWAKHIKQEMVTGILWHTKRYVEKVEKRYRLDPVRYLRNEKFNDEIIEQDKRIDVTEYKHDTTGMPMGKCKKCGKRDTYLNQWELYKGSDCCGEKVLPFK
jgi:hypothetical protein